MLVLTKVLVDLGGNVNSDLLNLAPLFRRVHFSVQVTVRQVIVYVRYFQMSFELRLEVHLQIVHHVGSAAQLFLGLVLLKVVHIGRLQNHDLALVLSHRIRVVVLLNRIVIAARWHV